MKTTEEESKRLWFHALYYKQVTLTSSELQHLLADADRCEELEAEVEWLKRRTVSQVAKMVKSALPMATNSEVVILAEAVADAYEDSCILEAENERLRAEVEELRDALDGGRYGRSG